MTSNESASSSTTKSGKPSYWRSLSELRGSEAFDQYLDREFPVAASEFPEGVSRRRWMQLMGASLAFAGVAGCRYPEETIEPFVIRPEGRIPGESYQRATNFELAGRVYNLLISCVDGRPLKIEPNTEHPSGVGTDSFSQASILGLYDPDRSRDDEGFLLRNVKEENRSYASDWPEFNDYLSALLENAGDGSAMALVFESTRSPSTVRMLSAVKNRFPAATLCRYDSINGDAMRQATTKVLGTAARQALDLANAEIVVALQADILGNDSGMLNNAAGYAKRRDPLAEDGMNRLYVVEGGFTSTGASADSRLALAPSQIPAFLAKLGRKVEELVAGGAHQHADGEASQAYDELPAGQRLERFIDVLAHDIAEKPSQTVIVVGEQIGAEGIEAGIRMNQKLGSLGTLQNFYPLPDGEIEGTVSLGELTAKMNAGEIQNLLILDGNPVVTAPGDIDFAAAISKVADSVYAGLYNDETGALCRWSIPLTHPLEGWSDSVNDNGFYGVGQPQILPLLGGKDLIEVLAIVAGESQTDPQAILRRTADTLAGEGLSDREWRQLLHDGFAKNLNVDAVALELKGDGVQIADEPVASSEVNIDSTEIIFAPADGLYDGRFANNGWLQEMPQSLTKLSWDNAAVMSPLTAKALEIEHGQFVVLTVNENKVALPVYEMPGCAAGVITTTLGYGRTRAGMVGGHEIEGVEIIGTDLSPIRTAETPAIAYGVKARRRLDRYKLSTTQDHWAIDEGGREETETRSFSLVREGTAVLLAKNKDFVEAKGPHVPHVGADGSPWKEPINAIEEKNAAEGNPVPQWGMSIDLSKCTGCNACVVACQSENNVPIVGREQVLNSREMHWLRVDRYFQGDEENAEIVQQPVACMHCETAPCEQVCPVAATVHTDEGINAMAYNRCIGTRYCANNCPFKVRRFNYFNYNEEIGTGYGWNAFPSNIENANRKLQALVMNPEVTVRGRGVMEKCTYCVQRVESAKITARKEGGREIRDGDVVTACQSACPTKAIEFGNIADSQSAVAKSHKLPHSYGMLSQLNVKPRTEYLARIRNTPSRLMTRKQIEDLETLQSHDDHGHDDHGHDDHQDATHADNHADHDHAETREAKVTTEATASEEK
ncbi:TAT-variant-translocated molybdopterin oxidoreductase [Rubripirellula sp.]|nr:TAT-variant-translocated molybdopterin oxidoreductase [Rubripirellula sp.]